MLKRWAIQLWEAALLRLSSRAWSYCRPNLRFQRPSHFRLNPSMPLYRQLVLPTIALARTLQQKTTRELLQHTVTVVAMMARAAMERKATIRRLPRLPSSLRSTANVDEVPASVPGRALQSAPAAQQRAAMKARWQVWQAAMLRMAPLRTLWLSRMTQARH